MTPLNNYPTDRSSYCIIQGVQNEILFFVRDLDRNVVSTNTFQTVTITIVDYASSTILMTRNLTVVDPTTALYMLTILPSETITWKRGPLRWSLTVTRADTSSVMLWTDMNYTPYGILDVKEGPIPMAQAATILDPSTFTINTMIAYSPSLRGASQLGYQNGMHTFALYPVMFTGSIEIDGSLLSQPSGDDNDWFVVSTNPLTAANVVSTINVLGNFLWLRMRISTMSGAISQVLYKS